MLARRLERTAQMRDPYPTISVEGLTVDAVEAMSETDAHDELLRRRWPNGPSCPRCATDKPYFYEGRRRWSCRKCRHQFSITSGTPLASHKVGYKALLTILANSGSIRSTSIMTNKAAMDQARRKVLMLNDWHKRCLHGQVSSECVDCRYDAMSAEYLAGVSCKGLAKKYGLAESSVHEGLTRRGVSMRRRGAP